MDHEGHEHRVTFVVHRFWRASRAEDRYAGHNAYKILATSRMAVQCIWPAADGSDDFLVQLIVAGTTVGSYDELARQYREEPDTDPATAIHRIEGTGELAVGSNEMAMVQIFSGSTMVRSRRWSRSQAGRCGTMRPL